MVRNNFIAPLLTFQVSLLHEAIGQERQESMDGGDWDSPAAIMTGLVCGDPVWWNTRELQSGAGGEGVMLANCCITMNTAIIHESCVMSLEGSSQWAYSKSGGGGGEAGVVWPLATVKC